MTASAPAISHRPNPDRFRRRGASVEASFLSATKLLFDLPANDAWSPCATSRCFVLFIRPSAKMFHFAVTGVILSLVIFPRNTRSVVPNGYYRDDSSWQRRMHHRNEARLEGRTSSFPPARSRGGLRYAVVLVSFSRTGAGDAGREGPEPAFADPRNGRLSLAAQAIGKPKGPSGPGPPGGNTRSWPERV